MAASWACQLLRVQGRDDLGGAGQGGRAEHVGRAALVAGGAGGPADAVEPGLADRAAAGEVRGAGVEPVRAAHQDAGAERGVELVAGEGEVVDVVRGDVDRGGAGRAGRRRPRSGRRIRAPARPGRRIGRISPVTLEAPVTARRLTSPCSSSAAQAARWWLASVAAATTLRCGTPCHGSRLAWCSMSRYSTSPVWRWSSTGRQPASRLRESVVLRVKMTASSAPAADEVPDDVAGVLVDGRADLRGVAGAAVHARVVRQDLVEVGRNHGQRRRGGAVVEVGVADVAALDQRGLDLGAGDGGQRTAGGGNSRPVQQAGVGGGGNDGSRHGTSLRKGPL